jgi:O-antigen ligase
MWEILLFISLLIGQLGRIQITSDIALYVQDVVIFCYLLFHLRLISQLQWNKVSFLKPLAIVCGVCLFSLVANIGRFQLVGLGVGLLYLLRFYLYVSVFAFVMLSKKPLRFWLKWLYYLGVGYAVLGFIQLMLYPNLRNLTYLGWDPHYMRLFSTLFDPNFVGCIIILSLFLGLYLFTEIKSKLCITLSQGVLLLALLFTYSRSSYLALMIGLAVFIGITKQWRYFFVLLCIPLLAVLFPSLGGISTDIGRMWSVSARLTNLQEGSTIFLNSPIIGYGFNTLRSLPRSDATSPYGYISNAAGGIDNSILFILVTTGTIGLAAFAYLGIRIFCLGTLIKKDSLKAIYFSILSVLVVHSMFVNSLFYPQIVIWFWIFLGALEGNKPLISRN